MYRRTFENALIYNELNIASEPTTTWLGPGICAQMVHSLQEVITATYLVHHTGKEQAAWPSQSANRYAHARFLLTLA
jgi:hypothetical protein